MGKTWLLLLLSHMPRCCRVSTPSPQLTDVPRKSAGFALCSVPELEEGRKGEDSLECLDRSLPRFLLQAWCSKRRFRRRWALSSAGVLVGKRRLLFLQATPARQPLQGQRALEVPSSQAFTQAGATGRVLQGSRGSEGGKGRHPPLFQLFLCRSNLLNIPTFTCKGNRFAF